MTDAYSREGGERLLAYTLTGGRWRREDAPDDDMPKSKGNPAHQGTEMAEHVDAMRAWWWCMETDAFIDPAALWGIYGEGRPMDSVTAALSTPRQTLEYRLYRDVDVFHAALNAGARPSPNYMKEAAWASSKI